ncbi:hypothetical protein ACFLWY_04745 [Chloroflexota bacterium]
MAKWILAVDVTCADPAREAEFNDWYTNMHLADMLSVPHFIKATRYENIEPSERKPKYLAVYEIETDNIKEADRVLREHVAKWKVEGRFHELVVIEARAIYKKIAVLSR